MIRPLYRWKSFSFGVLVIAFLGWAWGKSMNKVIWIVPVTDGKANVVHGGGEVMFVFQSTGSSISRGIYKPVEGPGQTWFPSAVKSERRLGVTRIHVAHWFLILLFLVPWSGWLAWRWRRMKRIGKQIDTGG